MGTGIGENRYGVANLEYDLITTLSNMLQAQETLEKYASDALEANDQECATLFRTIREANRGYVDQLRAALARHLGGREAVGG
ncbi:MAG: hypothetical protein AVDCRST_MAG70-667 [uncultured Thermomicrobiales bacterium]|uniref:DUF2383 domain-containing protein n=2 Tax=uncultured Thermomicrobiales bacterium TaxID=1645740 RepID=A0A6J4UH27_9BACT|nr:MAG: hypothetical protein AVDCRST_MAG70-667 [uncultured Thermomicrobiales bacterium]